MEVWIGGGVQLIPTKWSQWHEQLTDKIESRHRGFYFIRIKINRRGFFLLYKRHWLIFPSFWSIYWSMNIWSKYFIYIIYLKQLSWKDVRNVLIHLDSEELICWHVLHNCAIISNRRVCGDLNFQTRPHYHVQDTFRQPGLIGSRQKPGTTWTTTKIPG